jgi:FtsZ-interacting cell division protein ZipA
MATSTTVLIIVAAVVAILLIAGLVWVARNKRTQQRHVEAGKIREDATQETLLVKQQEALAEETAAKARAAQAEADVKAAQASGLQQQAAVHRGEAVSSRDHLNEQWDRADTLDPSAASDTQDPASPADTRAAAHDEPQPTAGSR